MHSDSNAPTRAGSLEAFLAARDCLLQHRKDYEKVRLEFSGLSKTISGKIRRVQLRALELEPRGLAMRREGEFWEDDFTD